MVVTARSDQVSEAKKETWGCALGSLKKTMLYLYNESLWQIHYPFLIWILCSGDFQVLLYFLRSTSVAHTYGPGTLKAEARL